MGCGATKSKVEVIDANAAIGALPIEKKATNSSNVSEAEIQVPHQTNVPASNKGANIAKNSFSDPSATKINHQDTFPRSKSAANNSLRATNSTRTLEVIDDVSFEKVASNKKVLKPIGKENRNTTNDGREVPPLQLPPIGTMNSNNTNKKSIVNTVDYDKRSNSSSDLKLPEIRKPAGNQNKLEPIVFEVDLKKERNTKKSRIQSRLEDQKKHHRRTTAAGLERKLKAAEDRRLEQQEERVKKAQESVATVQKRKFKIKQLEDKKTEQLRKLIEEKKHMAELHRIEKEQEIKKKSEEDARHAAEVLEKAKLRKVDQEDDDQP